MAGPRVQSKRVIGAGLFITKARRRPSRVNFDQFLARQRGNDQSWAVITFRSVPVLFLAVAACSTSPTATPVPTTIEAYKKAVEDKLGPHWYRLAEANQRPLAVGTVKARFEIPVAGGRPRNLKIVSNTGNWMNVVIARRAIGQLRAPPVPPGLLKPHDDYLTFEETFTIYEQP